MTSTGIAPGSEDVADEKTPLIRDIRLLEVDESVNEEDGPIDILSERPRHVRKKRKRRKSRRCTRILGILFIIVLIWALIRRIIPFTSSWACLSASRFFLLSTTKCSLPSWYDIQPDEDGHLIPPNITTDIPQYVFDYAPLVHLFSDEKYWPSIMTDHLAHTTPELDYTPLDLDKHGLSRLNLSNLNELNFGDDQGHGRHIFLTSDDNVENRPDWLTSERNRPTPFTAEEVVDSPPSSNFKSFRAQPSAAKESKKTIMRGGRSPAPAVLIAVPKPNGILDAFFFFFYSYNHGNEVLRLRFGNHVGDWEHTMIRFQSGVPKAVFFSEHDFGTAYTYPAVEKIGPRPVLYSATGTHAMYATPGTQPYILPLGLLHDRTDRGPVWDPAANLLSYTYDYAKDQLHPATINPDAPTGWFYFAGHWGDKHYPLDDHRQYSFLGELHYVSGPLGPRFKHLSRRKVCEGPYSEPCELKHWLGGGVGLSRSATEGGEGDVGMMGGLGDS